jgi:hypothetical protein
MLIFYNPFEKGVNARLMWYVRNVLGKAQVQIEIALIRFLMNFERGKRFFPNEQTNKFQ